MPRAIQYFTFMAPFKFIFEGVSIERCINGTSDGPFTDRTALMGTPVQMCVILSVNIKDTYFSTFELYRYTFPFQYILNGNSVLSHV